MNWPFFTHPALLGGLAAVAIPILIHLLLKSRKQRMRFSTLRFFQQPDERANRRRKLRHWLLLLTRLLLLVLLVLGFARPYLASLEAGRTEAPRRHAIMVVDRSISMQASDREGLRWARAEQAARKVLAGLRPGELASLIDCGIRAETLLGPAPPEAVLNRLKDLKPAQTATELGRGLSLAGKLAETAGTRYSNIVYIVSDLQRASCRNLASYPIPLTCELKVLPIGDLLAPNLAVTELNLESRGAAKPFVTVANFSDEESSVCKFQFLVDGKEEMSSTVRLPSGGSTNVEIALARHTPGWHSAEARVQAQDAQPLDDVRYQVFYAPPPIQVLAVEPRKQAKLFLEESFYLVSALDPAFGTTNQSGSPFHVEKTTPEELAGKLTARAGGQPVQAVVLPALKNIPSGLGARLMEYVRKGGGLLLLLGEGISANRYAAELSEVLPARLGKAETASDLVWRLWEKDAKSPVFSAFQRPNSGNLALAGFSRRFTLGDYDDHQVLARFQDGVPLLIARNLGQGRIVLVNSSADASWTDWPKHRTYVPWLHSVMRYLGGGNTETVRNFAAAFTAGAEADLEAGADLRKAPVRLRGLGGEELTGTTDERGIWRDCTLTNSGIHSMLNASGQEIRRFAVNVPPVESDLAAMSPTEFEQQIARFEPPVNASLADALFGKAGDRRELWRLCLLAAFVLLFMELLLANRTVTS